MYCSRCGHQNVEGASFCLHCGQSLQTGQEYTQPSAAPVPPYQPMGQSTPVYPPTPQQPIGPQPKHPVIETVRSLILSPLFLTAVIAFSAAILFSVFGSFGLTDAMMDGVMDSLYVEGLDMELDEYSLSMMSDSMGVGAVIGGLFGSIPSILLALGMWMLYASARNRQNVFISTGGLTLIKVLTIISLVSFCGLSALLMLLLAVIWAVAGGEMIADEAVILSVVMGILFVILAAVLAVYILYYVKAIKTIGTIQNTLQTGVPSDRVSMFLIVMCFISGASSALSSFSMLVMIAFGGMALLVATLAQAASSILFGVLLLQYRSRMQQLMAWAPPAPAAAPYVAAQQHYGAPMGQTTDASPAPPTEPVPVDEIPTEGEIE